MGRTINNEKKIYLIAVFANISIYACSTYYFSLMRKIFSLPLSYNYKLLALNAIGIIGNFGFSYWAFKKTNHRLIIGNLIIIQSLAFIAIKLFSVFKTNFLKYFSVFFIGASNAISNGGFNPVFDSLAINYLKVHDKLVNINTLRRMLAAGNFSTGIIINIFLFFTTTEKYEYYVPMAVSFFFAVFSSILIYNLSYNYSIGIKENEDGVSNRIPIYGILKYFFKWNFMILYLVIILNGCYKLYYTMLQRDQFLSLNLSNKDFNWVKSIGCLVEIIFSFVFYKIEEIISFKILFPVSVSLNVVKFFIFSYMRMENYTHKFKLPFFMILESMDKVIFYITNVSGNRILLNICKMEFLTLAQGIRYACFTGVGCLLAGVLGINLRNTHKIVLEADDFRHIFKSTKYISITTIIMSILLMFILFSKRDNEGAE